ncbi:MAG: class I SAM-dependent methyltransferase [Anaerolineales bacterium]|nr:class I SAM-dependent methyltransferase [Anaerolineales bacterium]
MTIQRAYNQWAATYDTDRNLTRDLDALVTRNTLSHQRYRFILELGCGTGKNTVTLAPLAGSLLALDFSAEMMAQAQAKVAAEQVRFAQADLTRPWPVEDNSVDLVICNLVLEHINRLDFIFAEAARVLVTNGRFFISELHPFRQYMGKKAVFEQDGQTTEIGAFVHHISDFLQTAAAHDLKLRSLNEWWHEEDQGKPPRLVTFMFEKTA